MECGRRWGVHDDGAGCQLRGAQSLCVYSCVCVCVRACACVRVCVVRACVYLYTHLHQRQNKTILCTKNQHKKSVINQGPQHTCIREQWHPLHEAAAVEGAYHVHTHTHTQTHTHTHTRTHTHTHTHADTHTHTRVYSRTCGS